MNPVRLSPGNIWSGNRTLAVSTSNILAVLHGVIVHQVNCQGVMGCGIALQIRNKWPIVYERYRAHKFSLGQIQLIQVALDLWVCNLAGQDRYGRDKRYTDYRALRVAFRKLNTWASKHSAFVHIPYKMGSFNAGGSWTTVNQIIVDELIDCTFNIHKFAGNRRR